QAAGKARARRRRRLCLCQQTVHFRAFGHFFIVQLCDQPGIVTHSIRSLLTTQPQPAIIILTVMISAYNRFYNLSIGFWWLDRRTSCTSAGCRGSPCCWKKAGSASILPTL